MMGAAAMRLHEKSTLFKTRHHIIVLI